jgi:hypothetical protein
MPARIPARRARRRGRPGRTSARRSLALHLHHRRTGRVPGEDSDGPTPGRRRRPVARWITGVVARRPSAAGRVPGGRDRRRHRSPTTRRSPRAMSTSPNDSPRALPTLRLRPAAGPLRLRWPGAVVTTEGAPSESVDAAGGGSGSRPSPRREAFPEATLDLGRHSRRRLRAAISLALLSAASPTVFAASVPQCSARGLSAPA